MENIRQRDVGYSLRLHYEGPVECYGLYQDGERKIYGVIDFSWLNDVTIFEDYLKKWAEAESEPLSELEFATVKNRFRRYFECWGDVTFDSTLLPTKEDLKRSLDESGIAYDKMGDCIIYESTPDVEKQRRIDLFKEKNKGN
jgi:hypothetical protein